MNREYFFDRYAAEERSGSEHTGELFRFYNNLGISRADLIENAYRGADQSFLARDATGGIIGAVRSSFDGVYSMIWDLQVGPTIAQRHPELRGMLITNIMDALHARKHNLIAAIVPAEEAPFYHACGLPYGDELTATVIDPTHHALWESPYPIQQDEHVTPPEVSSLFMAAKWQDEATVGEQFAQAFNTALCNFTARDANGRLIGMVRTHFDGKIAMRWNLVVHPDYRKEGIGFKLLSHLRNFIISGGYESYALAVNHMVDNYRKLGIVPVQNRQVVTNNPKL